MRCFVTGATGFVGGCLVDRLLERGHTVVALSHDEAGVQRLVARGALGIAGVPEGLDDAILPYLQRADVLFHCDAYLDPEGPTEIFREVNVQGTRRLLELALRAETRRIVLLSSQAVVWGGQSLLDTSEEAPYPTSHVDPYSASRAEAERLVLAAARAGRIEAVAIRPGWTWGPGDTALLPLLVRRALKGAIPLVGSGEHLTATTYIEHLLDALEAAAERPGISGKAFFVSDDLDLTQRAFIDLQLGAVGVVASYRHIPSMVARAAAAVIEATSPLVGIPLPLIRLVTGMAACEITHNTTRARQELGYESRISLEEGAARLHQWAIQQGGAEAIAAMMPAHSIAHLHEAV